MPYFCFSRRSGDRKESFFWEMPSEKSQNDGVGGTSITQGGDSSTAISNDDRQTSAFATFISNYEKLPDYLKCCLDYLSIVTRRHPVEMDKLIRLLLAECLVPEKAGEVMEDLAEQIIGDLFHLGMLTEDHFPDILQVPCEYQELCVFEVDETYFVAKPSNLAIRAVIEDDGTNTLPNFKSLHIRSLFLITAERRGLDSSSTRGLSQAYMQTISSLQSLLVLDMDGRIEYLPNEVGDLVQLRYLALSNSNLDELPQTLGNLQKLQTLEIGMCRKVRELPIEVVNIQNLRHLLVSRCINDGEIRVPKEIGKLTNLYRCMGVYAGGGIASELGCLTQLRELGVKRVSEDHASELYAAIMKMENLISVKLEAEINLSRYSDKTYSLFPEFELFYPPPVLQVVQLTGALAEIPIWLSSMSNLTRLELHYSDLTETPTTHLQFLPKLKHLTLWQAYNAKVIGKEFCQAGGFPELQTLIIDSSFLVNWTEIVNGAFPRLKSLTLRSLNLRFIPEGLQNISTLEELNLLPMHGDLARRLKSTENYKIKHILKLTAYFEGGRFLYVGSPQEVLQYA